MRGVAVGFCALAVAACGSGHARPGQAPTLAASTTALTTPQGWRLVVSRPPGSSRIDVDLTVSGPLTLRGGCVEPLTVQVTRAGVPASTSPVATGASTVRCGAIVLERVAAGTTRTLHTFVAVPEVSGNYEVHASVAGSTAAGSSESAIALPVVTVSG